MLREDLRFLKLDSFRCEFMGTNLGIPCNFISYTSPDMTIEKLAGITFLHNVFPRARVMSDLSFMSKLWKVCDAFGMEDARFIPYWENTCITAKNKDVYVSLWQKETKTLLCVFSHHEVSSAELSIGKEARLRNVFTEKEYRSDDGNVTVDISRETLNLFEIKKDKE